MKNMSVPELDLDTRTWNNGHNVRETKPLLLAFAASKLGAEFPNNLDSLETVLGATLGEKIIRLSGGVIIGAKHQVKLADIKRVKCASNGTLGVLCVYTKEKGGFFDMPDMKLPLSEVTLPLLEAVMTRNTGNGIDFSQGNGFDQKNSEHITTMSTSTGARRWAERYKENKCTVIRESSCFDRGSCFCMRRALSIPAALCYPRINTESNSEYFRRSVWSTFTGR